MNSTHSYDGRNTPDSVTRVPKQSRPAKIAKSIRVRPWLLEQIEVVAEEQQLTFNEVVERALEDWISKQAGA